MSLSKDLVNLIKKTQETKTSPYDTQAEVVRIEGKTAWVHIPGGVDETPVKMTINAKAGDTVQVRVANGTAFLVGNGTAPPTDDFKAIQAGTTANMAVELAESAVAGVKGIINYFWHDADGVHVSTAPGDATSTGIKNVLVDSEGMDIRDGDTLLAYFRSEAIRLGKNLGYMEITPSSFSFRPSFGDPDFKYARQSNVSVTQTFIGDGVTREFDVFKSASPPTVTVNGSAATGVTTIMPRDDSLGSIRFSTAPATGAVIVVSYTTSWANPYYSFGINTITAPYGHAEGRGNTVGGIFGHAEGRDTTANGAYAHAQNHGTKASGESQTAIGKYNVEDTNNAQALIIGNGNSTTGSNAMAVTWNGDIRIAGNLYTGCASDSTGGVVYAVSRDSIAASASKSFTVATGKYYRVATASVPAALKGEYIVAVSSTGGVSSAPVRSATDLTVTTSTNTLTIANGSTSYAVAVRIEEI